EVASGLLLATLQGHAGLVYGVALSVEGRLLASGGLDGTIRLWEPVDKLRISGDWRMLAEWPGTGGMVYGVALSADGQVLASGSSDGTIQLWSLAAVYGGDNTTLGTHAPGVPPPAGLVQRLPSGRLLAMLQGHSSGVLGVA